MNHPIVQRLMAVSGSPWMVAPPLTKAVEVKLQTGGASVFAWTSWLSFDMK
jgi:hypothetical protein